MISASLNQIIFYNKKANENYNLTQLIYFVA